MPDLITRAQLVAFAPAALNPDAAAPALTKHMVRCEITTPRRIRHFMAHLAVESMYLARLEENLNYSVARLQQVWPSRFPNPVAAQPFARNPRELAHKVYGGRMGNDGKLDGWLYRGGGYVMLTGRDNYRLASAWTGLDLTTHPEWARTPAVAAQIACDFWRVKGINKIVDADKDEVVAKTISQEITLNEGDDLKEGTRAINGGLIGLDARGKALLRAGTIWK
jgi:putative chitinase